MADEGRPPENAHEVDAALEDVYDDIFQANQAIFLRSRQIASLINDLQERYAEQIALLEEAKRLHLEGAHIVSRAAGDILATEFGFTTSNEDEDEDWEDGEEEVDA